MVVLFVYFVIVFKLYDYFEVRVIVFVWERKLRFRKVKEFVKGYMFSVWCWVLLGLFLKFIMFWVVLWFIRGFVIGVVIVYEV